MVKLLLNFDASIKTKDMFGRTSIDITESHEQFHILSVSYYFSSLYQVIIKFRYRSCKRYKEESLRKALKVLTTLNSLEGGRELNTGIVQRKMKFS